ncbi:MAG TPA: PQQ-binding-like beta-propeller repeat protein [Pyrinomonadaceae bacterium]|nr:PQQ-binding-like beta-propeller repeat protein [Pyrinomonadaceae bacterium]
MKTQRKFSRGLKLVLAVVLLAVGAVAFAGQPFGAARGYDAQDKGAEKPAEAEAKQVKIDLGKAVKVKLPANMPNLTPTSFVTADGKRGWAVRVPGNQPLATPAYAKGVLFIGGGYGSHDFYAFDAKTGKLVWKIKTSDDGPTGAVVEDGLVAFNTESCTLIVVDAKTGKLVWQEWLGDPLMSQPAISKGRVFMAYPSSGRAGHQNFTSNQAHKSAAAQVPPKPVQQVPQTAKQGDDAAEVGSHKLLCADLKTGKHIWERAISADVISAPVVSEGKVYFTTFDGTSYCLDAEKGSVVWKKENAGTSAPVVVAGEVLMTQKEERDNKSYEGLKRLDASGDDKDKRLIASEEAAYLDENKGGGVALKAEAQSALDSSVGFGSAPAAAQLDRANSHIGVNTVVGGWAYQGSRAAYSRGQMLNAQGRYLNSVNAKSGGLSWRAEVSGGGLAADSQVFSPPALGEQFIYLSSSLGHLLSVNQKGGEVGFMYEFGEPMVFQPALAEGSVYVGTSNGLLICLKTGSPDADGWYAWGGNAEHNKNR